MTTGRSRQGHDPLGSDPHEAAAGYYRRARQIADSDAPLRTKRLAIALLYHEAGKLHGTAWRWTAEAIWRASHRFLVGEPEAASDYHVPRWIAAPRALRAAGHALCPECFRPLPDPAASDAYERRDRASWKQTLSETGLAGIFNRRAS